MFMKIYVRSMEARARKARIHEARARNKLATILFISRLASESEARNEEREFS